MRGKHIDRELDLLPYVLGSYNDNVCCFEFRDDKIVIVRLTRV